MLKLIVTITIILISNIASANEVKAQILKNSPNLSDSYATELAQAIEKYAELYFIPKELFTAILMQESSYNIKAVNKKCGYEYVEDEVENKQTCVVADVGIAQINVKTATAHKFNADRLQKDLEYSVRAGAIVLSWFKDTYSEKEPDTWHCRYNVGTAKFDKVKDNCQKYVDLVNRWI